MKMKFSGSALAFVLFASTASCGNTNSKQSESSHQPAAEQIESTPTETDDNTQASTQEEIQAEAEQAPNINTPQQGPAKALPAFTFYQVKSGISLTHKDLSKDKNAVFIFFDPGCGFCQEETKALSENIDKLKNADLYFVSMNSPALIAQFLKQYGSNLDNHKNVHLLYDKNQDFIRKIHLPNHFPANYVYGKDGQLKTYWEGEKKIEDILKAYMQ